MVNADSPGAAQPHLRVRVQEPDLLLKPAGQADVVGIHARHVLSFRQPAPSIERRREAASLVAMHADPRISLLIGREDGAGAVRRPVINNNELKILKRLSEDALDRLAHMRFSIAYRHHDRHDWMGFKTPTDFNHSPHPSTS